LAAPPSSGASVALETDGATFENASQHAARRRPPHSACRHLAAAGEAIRIGFMESFLRCIRPAASVLLVAAVLHQLGACPCGCPAHNRWVQTLAGWACGPSVATAALQYAGWERGDASDHVPFVSLHPAPERSESLLLGDLACAAMAGDCGPARVCEAGNPHVAARTAEVRRGDALTANRRCALLQVFVI
jgi:hypothetical protein